MWFYKIPKNIRSRRLIAGALFLKSVFISFFVFVERLLSAPQLHENKLFSFVFMFVQPKANASFKGSNSFNISLWVHNKCSGHTLSPYPVTEWSSFILLSYVLISCSCLHSALAGCIVFLIFSIIYRPMVFMWVLYLSSVFILFVFFIFKVDVDPQRLKAFRHKDIKITSEILHYTTFHKPFKAN